MGRMIYVPDEILDDVEILKRARRQGRCYDIICYDSKEENENEEERLPHTPLKEEEKEKEESNIDVINIKKSKKKFFSPPSFEEIKRYYEDQEITEYPVERFYNYYVERNWIKKDRHRVCDWRKEMDAWRSNGIKNKVNLDHDTRNKKTTDSAAQDIAREETDRRELEEWLDAHYPVSAEIDERAEAAIKEDACTLAEVARIAGTTAVYRRVIKDLYVLGKALNSPRNVMKLPKLTMLAQDLLHEACFMKMGDLTRFYRLCRTGQYGSFNKGLILTDLMRALRKFRA